jgi:hypothetical protein
VAIFLPQFEASHTFNVSSPDADTNTPPSGENTLLDTEPLCPESVAISLPQFKVSHTFNVPS